MIGKQKKPKSLNLNGKRKSDRPASNASKHASKEAACRIGSPSEKNRKRPSRKSSKNAGRMMTGRQSSIAASLKGPRKPLK